jgi:chemotaxis signal transduction protein
MTNFQQDDLSHSPGSSGSRGSQGALGSPGSQPPLSLSQLLALARTQTVDEQDAALELVHRGEAQTAEPEGAPYLLFTCADVECAAPLTHFREVLPTLPTTVAVPFSPPWVLGFFALHTDLIGLVDPLPFLFDSPELLGLSRARARNGRIIVPGSPSSGEHWQLAAPDSGPTALVIGAGERMLALAVAGVGDIAYIRQAEAHEQEQASAADVARIPAPRFHAGTFVDPDSRARLQLIKVDVLLETLIQALGDLEAARHE